MENNLDIRVAQIIDTHTIVINKGLSDEIRSSMQFLVYEEGEEIMDPISKRSLGNLEIPKGFFKVQHIQENMSVLISKVQRPSKLASAMLVFTAVGEQESLETIKIGDKVKVVNYLMS
jgi:hypothetical protein